MTRFVALPFESLKLVAVTISSDVVKASAAVTSASTVMILPSASVYVTDAAVRSSDHEKLVATGVML